MASFAALAAKSDVNKPKFDFGKFNLDRGDAPRLTFGGSTAIRSSPVGRFTEHPQDRGVQRVDVYIVVVPMTDGQIQLFRARDVPKQLTAYALRFKQRQEPRFTFGLGKEVRPKEARLFTDHKTNDEIFTWFVDVDAPHAYNNNLQIILTEFVRDTDPELRLATLRAYQRDYPSITLDGRHQIIPIDDPLFASARRDFVPGTFFTYEIVDSHQRLAEEAVHYLRDVQGIRSPIAMYFILRTALSRTYGSVLTIEKSAAMWRSYQSEFRRIDAEIREKPAKDGKTISGQAIDDVRFAVNAMMHLKFPTEESLISACPYMEPGQNFITALFSHECVCNCYTAYILAAADEVNRGAIVPIIRARHATVAILDTTRFVGLHHIQDAVEQCVEEVRPYITPGLPESAKEASFALSAMTWESDPVNPICAIVEAGFQDNQESFMVQVADEQTVATLRPYFSSRRVYMNNRFAPSDVSPCGLFDRVDTTWTRFGFLLPSTLFTKSSGQLPVDRILLEFVCLAHIFHMQPYRMLGVFLSPNIDVTAITKKFDNFIELQSREWKHAPLPSITVMLVRTISMWWRKTVSSFKQMEHAQTLRKSLARPQRFVDVTLFACDRAGADDMLIGVVLIAGSVLSRVLTLPSAPRSICRDFLEPLVGEDEYDLIKRRMQVKTQVDVKEKQDLDPFDPSAHFRILEHQQTRELFFVFDGTWTDKILDDLPHTQTLDSLGFTPMDPRLAQEILHAFLIITQPT